MHMHASPDTVFSLAADIARWPDILNHYRYVRMLSAGGIPLPERSCIARMSATRSGIPVSWTSIQTLDPAGRRVFYRHIAGATTNMDVVWEIVASNHGVSDVTITHDLFQPVGILRLPFARSIASGFFIHSIAEQTLAGIKQVVEQEGSLE